MFASRLPILMFETINSLSTTHAVVQRMETVRNCLFVQLHGRTTKNRTNVNCVQITFHTMC